MHEFAAFRYGLTQKRPRPGRRPRGADLCRSLLAASAGDGWGEDADHADALLPARGVRGNADLQDPRLAGLDHERRDSACVRRRRLVDSLADDDDSHSTDAFAELAH